MARTSDKEKLDKKTILILEALGIILLVVGGISTEDMARTIFLMTVGVMLMCLPLINRSDDDQKSKTKEQKPLKTNQRWLMLIFSFSTFGVIGYFVFLDDWIVVMILSFLIGDFALIFLLIVIEDFRDKRKEIKMNGKIEHQLTTGASNKNFNAAIGF